MPLPPQALPTSGDTHLVTAPEKMRSIILEEMAAEAGRGQGGSGQTH
jgi:hypothetical protein